MNLEEGQKLARELSEKWNVPTVEVEMIDDGHVVTEYFDPESWILGISSKTTPEDFKHEYHHFLVALLVRAPELEEDMSNFFASK